MVEDQGFVKTLCDLVGDSNPSVVANAIAAVQEIENVSGKQFFKVTKANLQKLLAGKPII